MNPPRTLSRRHFILTAAMAGIGRAARGAVIPGTRRVVVGAHPWVYAAKQPGYDFTPLLPQIFGDFKYAGYDGIELMQYVLLHDDAVARIGDLSRQHELPVIGSSFNGAMWDRHQHPLVLERAEKVVTRLSQLGGRTLGTSVGPLPGAAAKRRKTADQLDAQAECLRQLIALCTRHGVVLNLHNHTYEVQNDLADLRGTLERIPDVKLGPDLNWLIRGGVDPVAFIHQYGSHIVFLHLRDQRRDGRWVEALGEGDTDFHAIAQALHQLPFTGDAIVELAHEADFVPTRPYRESFRISREFVRQTFGY
jgi:sugar phosphate isomerase/epimerase